jgi:hypothetical protein
MFKGYTYTLNAAERQLAIDTGKARTARARGAKLAYSKLAKDQSQVFIDQNGAAGEIVFAAMLLDHGLYTKDQYKAALVTIREAGITSAYQNLDDGDLVWNGMKIDVKCTEYVDGGLWLTNNKFYAKKLDAYVLITGSSTDWTYTFRGFIESSYCLTYWLKSQISDAQGLRLIDRWKPAYFYQRELNNLCESVSIMKAEETAYIRNIREVEDPRAEAKFVKELGVESEFWDQWIAACSGYFDEPSDFFNVIDMVADQLSDELATAEAHIDDLIKLRKEEGIVTPA